MVVTAVMALAVTVSAVAAVFLNDKVSLQRDADRR